MREILLYFALKYQGDYFKIYDAIARKEMVSELQKKAAVASIQCQYVTLLDEEYPTCLKTIASPPIVLFYYGDIHLLKKEKIVAVIGKRKNTCYGKEMTQKIVKGLAKYNGVIISGLAKGIDGIAHEAALNNHLKTIAVLGSGIDECYPIENKKLYEDIKENGLLLSEYPGNTKPIPKNFLIRNRIIAAVAEYIVVIEAKIKSGTMNTVSYGLDYGKEIACVPYPATEESGCNLLIKQGAKLIEQASDLFE